MKLFSTDFCVLMILGAGILCQGDGKDVRVIDRTCDMEKIELPPAWRSQCVGPNKKLRRDVDYATRVACQKLLANERIRKKRKCP